MNSGQSVNGLFALVEVLAPSWPVLEPAQRSAALVESAAFVRKQLAISPLYVRFGFALIAGAFQVFAVAYGAGRPFALQSPDHRTRMIERWQGLCRPTYDHIRVLRSLVMLSYCENAAVLGALGAPTSEARQEAYRGLRRQQSAAAQ